MKHAHPKAASGFTLIEVMIVASIIAILATVSMPAYRDYTARTHMAEVIAFGHYVAQKAIQKHLETGRFTHDGSYANAGTHVNSKYVDRVEQYSPNATQSNAIHVYVTEDTFPGATKGSHALILYITDMGGSYKVTCAPHGGAATIPDRYVPSSCRQ